MKAISAPVPGFRTWIAALALAVPAARAEVILQYFESRWETIERRMPDIFMAGYDALWVPPVSLADTGGFSVGYDVFDRFHLGTPFQRTLYGTESSLTRMIREADAATVNVFIDLVLNHNGFRDLGTPGFVASGDYPGFALTLPGDIDGDFHGSFDGGDLNGRLAGLIDIAQEKNHVFIRHPVTPGDPLNIPGEPALESNRRYYPDIDFNSPASLGNTAGDVHTHSGFNLSNPLAGDPVPENATGLLIRHTRWLHEVIGADGFRLDAVKHVPQFFWNDFYDPALDDSNPDGSTPFSFGEVFDGNFGVLNSYTRKDLVGNRDVLDFPLYFTMRDILNGNGFGDMRGFEFASFDGSDGNANDGSRGVQFVSSHDNGPPANDNIAYAHILTRTGFPVVYFNALEFGTGRDFPQRGRGDALGGEFGDRIIRLVDIHHEYARGAHRTRWIDGDAYVYERENALLVGLNDNGASAATRNLVNLAFRNVTLVELTGNAGASATVNVDGSGNATVTIPSNANGRGYAAWGLAQPRGLGAAPLAITPVSSTIAPDAATVPHGQRRITPIEVITADSATLTLTMQDENLDDNAIVRIDAGAQDIIGTGLFPGGEFRGYQTFTTSSPGFGGNGTYSAALDISQLSEGLHYIEAVAFLRRVPSTLPAIYQTFRKVICVDRVPPPMALRFPGRTGAGDVQSVQYEVVLDCADFTANSVHVLPDFAGNDAAALAAVSPASRANQVDRGEFRFNWTEIGPGLHTLVVVAFEETGNASVTRFDNIDASVSVPEVQLQNLASLVTANTVDDIRVLVDIAKPGGGFYTFDPTGTAPDSFNVVLTVDGTAHPAQAFSPGLVGSENTLYQQDTDLGDEFDVFRFNWRGYGLGAHSFEVSAELNDGSEPPSLVTQSVQVAAETPGAQFAIVHPAPPAPGQPPAVLLQNPATLSVSIAGLESTARSLQLFVQSGETESLLLTQSIPTPPSSTVLTASVGSVELFNGAASLRVRSWTGLSGTGIPHEESTQVLIIGASDFAPAPSPRLADGQDNDWTGTPAPEIHSITTSNGEWIYTGGAGDCRTDLGDDPDIGNLGDAGDFNMDLTEMRVAATATDLHFLARLRDIGDVRRPSFAVGIDTDEPGDMTSVISDFIGDESGTFLDASGGRTWDFSVQVHFVNGSFSQVEVFDDDDTLAWFAPAGESSYISAENDLIEFSIPRAALGLAGAAARTITIQAATFENQRFGPDLAGGYNNEVDSTRDIGAGPDAVDVAGGQVGNSENAYGRAFSDGPGLSDGVIDSPDNAAVALRHDIVIPAPADSGSPVEPSVLSVTPADNAILPETAGPLVTITTNEAVNSALVAVNGQIAPAIFQSSGGGSRTWAASAPALAEGANAVTAVAFTGAAYTGRSATAGLTYQVNIPLPTADTIVQHILGASVLTGDALLGADMDDNGVIDARDVVLRVNAP